MLDEYKMKKSTFGPNIDKSFKLFADEWIKEILAFDSFQDHVIGQLKKQNEGDMVFKGAQWLAKAEGTIPYIYSTLDPEHRKWNGDFDESKDLTFGIGHKIVTEDEFKYIRISLRHIAILKYLQRCSSTNKKIWMGLSKK